MFTFTKSNVAEFKALTNATAKPAPAPFAPKPNNLKTVSAEGVEMKSLSNNNHDDDEGVVSDVYKALAQALVNDEENQIEAWLNAGGDLNQTLPEPYAPKVTFNDLEYGLDEGSLLQIAACLGKDNIIRLLMKRGALSVINQPQLSGSLKGTTPLYGAAVAGHTTTIALLIENGVNVHQELGPDNFEGENALFGAVWEGQADVVKLLLKQPDSNVNQIGTRGDVKGKGLLCSAIENNFDLTAEALLDNGADVNLATYVRTPLYVASRVGNLMIAKRLLKLGADVNEEFFVKDGEGSRCPLYAAVREGHTQMVSLLVEHNADIFCKLDKIKETSVTKEALKALKSHQTAITLASTRIRDLKYFSMNASDGTSFLTQHDDLQFKYSILKQWGLIVKTKVPLEKICEELAKTDLSEEKMEAVLTALLKARMDAEPKEAGKPILHMANRATSSSDAAATAAPPVNQQNVPSPSFKG